MGDEYDEGTDEQLFNSVNWDIEFANGEVITNVYGYYLDAGNLIT